MVVSNIPDTSQCVPAAKAYPMIKLCYFNPFRDVCAWDGSRDTYGCTPKSSRVNRRLSNLVRRMAR